MGPTVVVPSFHQHLFDHLRFGLRYDHVFRFHFRFHRALVQMRLDYVGSLVDLGPARGQMAYVHGCAHDYLLEEFQPLE